MDKARYYAALGLKPTATAAEVEASYLALSQHLDPKAVEPSLRQWAEQQAALIDEAYAALTEDGDDVEEVSAKAARVAAPPRARIAAKPAAKLPARRYDDEVDEDFDASEDDYDDNDEYEEEEEEEVRPPRRAVTAKPVARPRDGQSWRQAGHRRAGSRPPARRKQPSGQVGGGGKVPGGGDNRAKLMVLGLGVGLLVVAIAFVAMQAGLFGGKKQADGQAAFDQARYDQLKSIVAGDPNNYSALFELGEMNIDAGRYEETITWFQRVLAVRPNDVHAMQDIGTASFNLGNIEKAREMWLKALEVDPNDPQTRWNLAFLYASLSPPDIEAANREWQKVIELSPNSELARLAQSHIDSYKNRFPATGVPGPATSGSPAASPATPGSSASGAAPTATPAKP